ncbi:hypothetical protein [Paludisphaera borealis]|uniref:Uncharacterized protein n=1 Tax=Paludisphaera borealis TaxID=1387353 RepID=A0A1U7CRS6_9BACT|nr:hypothetical protein [Paludisphaera borealis]APW61596.1 hypothetical protein BSF38_03117 [Paludisphaera borealis]
MGPIAMLDLLNDANPLSDFQRDALRASIADMKAGRVSPAEDMLAEMRQILGAKQGCVADGAEPNSLLPLREKVPRSGG